MKWENAFRNKLNRSWVPLHNNFSYLVLKCRGRVLVEVNDENIDFDGYIGT